MEKILGYNRNIAGGKRPHKKICRFGKYKKLHERFIAESEALMAYQKRVGQLK